MQVFPPIVSIPPRTRVQRLSARGAGRMKTFLAMACMGVCTGFATLALPLHAHAQSETSVALSLLPVASVVGAASATGAAAGALLALPAALSLGGAVLTVIAVEASANGTVYLLERASDGARASVRLAGRAAGGAATAVGTAVTVSVIATGVLLSTAGEVLAFVPNVIGRGLMHNEKLT